MAKPSFVELLRRRIKADGRSIYRISKDAGLHVAITQRLMNGERTPRLDTAERLCRVVGLDLRPVED